MSFIDALSVLSKSSSFAVSTENDRDLELSKIKSDLYVAMPIEEDFLSLLAQINSDSKKVIFLCGSSGDGKSELMLRAKQKFTQPYIHFHLDATHSFEPHDNAIVTLDRIFSEFETGSHSLVIGINIGMLGNYAEEAELLSVREKIKKYLEQKDSSDDFNFINFEDYPKFEIVEDGYKSEFITRILTRITSPTSKLYELFIKEESTGIDSVDCLKFVNYKLLCNEQIQKVLIELLLKIRLFRNQFITARTFLDLIYELITKKDYLFNNLFLCNENEILEKAIEFDPSRLRTKTIDRFVIAYELNTLTDDFDAFKQILSEEWYIKNLSDSNSYIRLFYILKFLNLGNNYHKKFTDDFSENLLLAYLDIYRHHTYYDAVKSRLVLRNFYNKELLNAIRGYINKKVPYLEDDQFLIAEYGNYKVVSHLNLTPDFSAIEKKQPKNGKGYFNVYIRIKDFSENESDPTVEFSIDINLYELLSRLRAGYRPNKNDRSVVVILNEIVNRLLNFANKSNKINFKSNLNEIKFIREDEYIEVGY
ncbi:DNA phosphorothioation-dependent restriction protein DptF [Acinetobacter equi]|uniref:Restriction endonuclease n=1 Tax=Acinetobacter equi TaxID=1324350 RepID=A0A0N9W0Y7_9GAMM|nr:DNA phosphorothioation-dependent restriction protein DptF [Acinetobacter equi]ALH94678.1 restriction endonuclease [Acinetobacter equi]